MSKINKSKEEFGHINRHYWEWPIASYLFLGGCGGGAMFLASILAFFVFPGGAQSALVQGALAWPIFLSIVFLALGCVLLVGELGQPLVFIRAFVKSTSVIAWGARLLTVAMIFAVIWFASFIPWDWFLPVANFLVPFREFCLALAGIAGIGVVLYTGIMLSSLKAHSFWATPALPILFTISALSTACALIALSFGWWPMDPVFYTVNESNANDFFTAWRVYGNAEAGLLYTAYHVMNEALHLLHTLDVILVACEVVVLLVMVLSFLGAGNKCANAVAHKWVHGGKWAFGFWFGMIFAGLLLPEAMYVFWSETAASTVVAPVLVLCGGLLLRFMIVYSDERAPLPGEKIYYGRLVSYKADFLHKWKYGENLF